MGLYISSSFWLLRVESRDFFQPEKEKTACKAEQIHKMTTIFIQNGNLGPFWVKIVVILWIRSALQAVLSFSAWEKSSDSTPNSPKLEDMYSTYMFWPALQKIDENRDIVKSHIPTITHALLFYCTKFGTQQGQKDVKCEREIKHSFIVWGQVIFA